ncbi:hypothetical protein CASFOL_000827 [Castilleja foliolosa]|uniref:UBN2_3 domain-containing protein n=1 Tax=Castilleja foliolosa TaxID=1961234 RepID=A0ABD3ELC2_9LAMI
MATTGSSVSDALTGSISSTAPVTTTATINASGNPIFSTVQSTSADPIIPGVTGSAANTNPAIQLDQETLNLLLESVGRRYNLLPLGVTTGVQAPTDFGTVPSGMTGASASIVFGTIPSGMTGTSVPSMFSTAPSTVNVIHPTGMMGASAPTMSAPLHTSRVMPTTEKPPKFGGEGFKRWQQKMLFYLTMIGFVNFVKEDEPPTPAESETNFVVRAAYDNWHNGDHLCKGFLLSSLEDSLSNVYANVKTSKLIWEALDKKYSLDEAGTKKQLTSNEAILEKPFRIQHHITNNPSISGPLRARARSLRGVRARKESEKPKRGKFQKPIDGYRWAQAIDSNRCAFRVHQDQESIRQNLSMAKLKSFPTSQEHEIACSCE